MRLYWQAGLNNGETYTEGKGKFIHKPDTKSPWLQLQDYIKQNGLTITSLCLTDGRRTFNLPSAGKNPKFSQFANAEKPTNFVYGQPVGQDLKPGAKLHKFYLIEAQYTYFYLQLWVDAENTNNSWVLVSPQSIISKRVK